MLLSIVVPVYNEEENIAIFYEAVTDVMSGLTYDYELIYVDDGSSDSSSMILREIAYNDKHVKVLLLVILGIRQHLRVVLIMLMAMQLLQWTVICSIHRH